MEKGFSFYPRINSIDGKIETRLWGGTVALYNSGKYRETISAFMKYLGAEASLPVKGDAEIQMPHGSVIVGFRIKGDRYFIETPFLNMPPSPASIPAMRKSLEVNFTGLTMPKITQREGKLYFCFEDDVKNCAPLKLYYVLEEICQNADYYDDFYIEKFGAKRINEPELSYFNPAQKKTAYEIFTKVLKSACGEAENFIEKRVYGRACDVMSISLMQLDYVLAPQGDLGRLLTEAYTASKAGAVEDGSVKTLGLVKSLLSYDRQKFDAALFFPRFLIPFKKIAGLGHVQDYMVKSYDLSAGDIDAGDFTMASIELYHTMYALMWSYTIPKDVRSAIESALKNAADKPWQQASRALFAGMDKIMKMRE